MNAIVKPKISIGLLVFILVIVLMFVIAAPVQAAWGMWGLAATELLLLACAIIPALILKWDLKEIFVVRKPTLRQIFGVLVLWLGGYIAVLALTMIIAYFFPQGMANVSSQLLDLFNSVPFPVTFFILAVMPAVCEEALHRGLILHTFKGSNKWTTIIAMGLIFGIFHLDPYRFLGTAVLGILLTYIMVETRNLLLPMLFHFVNNSLSALSSQISVPTPEVIEIPLISVGVYLILTAVVPFMLVGGSRLLKSRDESRRSPISKKVLFTAIALTVIIAVTGVGITGVSAWDIATNQMLREPIFETSFSGNVNNETQANELEFSTQEDGDYTLILAIQGTDVLTNMTITSSSGEEVFTTSCEAMTYEGTLELEAGDYTVLFTYAAGTEFKPVSVDAVIK